MLVNTLRAQVGGGDLGEGTRVGRVTREGVTWVWRGDLGRGTQVGGGDPGLGDLGDPSA